VATNSEFSLRLEYTLSRPIFSRSLRTASRTTSGREGQPGTWTSIGPPGSDPVISRVHFLFKPFIPATRGDFETTVRIFRFDSQSAPVPRRATLTGKASGQSGCLIISRAAETQARRGARSLSLACYWWLWTE